MRRMPKSIQDPGRAVSSPARSASKVASMAGRVLASRASSPTERTLAASALARASHRRGVVRVRRAQASPSAASTNDSTSPAGAATT
jgi:hypothetical protein